ncbi:hypothetical protein XOO0686 [Xanthomonas oryzae pv. oryzae KACC 10331]|uniref:Uncharacterized protein n=1 Tax=Xanthomonas oryzae pv. oryzae (strain KACC10331 / KXO85) TaxID=291331 RepID=Q5H530_XANOR|nr:hypothetical protein XOO0686 [Xanthomonas oryzae pv. oryzae KACC 10331]
MRGGDWHRTRQGRQGRSVCTGTDLRAANKTTALTARRARPVLGIGMDHASTAVVSGAARVYLTAARDVLFAALNPATGGPGPKQQWAVSPTRLPGKSHIAVCTSRPAGPALLLLHRGFRSLGKRLGRVHLRAGRQARSCRTGSGSSGRRRDRSRGGGDRRGHCWCCLLDRRSHGGRSTAQIRHLGVGIVHRFAQRHALSCTGQGRAFGVLGHHHDTDATVDRVLRVGLVEQHRRRQPHHARHLGVGHATAHQCAARGIGTVGAEFPVGVAGIAAVGRGIGVAGDADVVGHLINEIGQLVQDRHRVRLELVAADVEHRAVLLVHDLDAQAIGREIQQQLILERLQRLALVDGLFQFLHQRFQALFVLAAAVFGGVRGIVALAAHFVLLPLGHVGGAAELDHRGAGAARPVHARRGRHRFARQRAGVAEVFGDRRTLFLGGGRHQPQHQEEGHHRGHEVGKRHLPGAAMMAAALHLLDPSDDDGGFGLGHDRGPT